MLIIQTQPPYGSNRARETMDIALAFAVMDVEVTLLFLDDGVYQCLRHQQAKQINQKDIAKSLQAAGLYGIEKFYVHRDSLEARRIGTDELIDGVELIENHQLSLLIDNANHVMHQ